MLLLSQIEKRELIERLPKIELSYDTILHKKVSADFYIIIPKGKKVLIWFTYFKNMNRCFMLELDKFKNISNIYNIKYCFTTEIAYNTILYGTIINLNNTSSTFFTCEDIILYKNIQYYKKNYIFKLHIIKELFTLNIKNTKLFNKNFIISIPIIKNTYNEIQEIIYTLPYDYYGIQVRYANKYYSSGIIKYITNNNKNKEAIFSVSADIENDIYLLHYMDNVKTKIFYNIAMIPDYKTSVFMNNLFRYIKENKNLDLLEESDDDEEFQNTNTDKFVALNKFILMKCVYSNTFKKWKPLCVVDEKSIIVNIDEIINLEN
jgi:hypothetical protein